MPCLHTLYRVRYNILFGIPYLESVSNTPNPIPYASVLSIILPLRILLKKSRVVSCPQQSARIQVAQLHEHIANQQADMLHKLSTSLIRDYDLIAIEDLVPSNMVKNHKLARSISDASWYEFRRQLEYKSKWYRKQVAIVDRFFPSSQLCSCCGTQWPGTKDLSVKRVDLPGLRCRP